MMPGTMTDRTPTGQVTELPTGNRQDPDRAFLSVGAAARRLDVTPDAIRSRLHRGTLEGEKIAGVWRVFLSRQDATTGQRLDARQDATGPKQESDGLRQATDRSPVEALLQAKDETISRLDDEVSYLRAQLDQQNRERAAERERFDIIHREALNRIEALTAGPVADAPAPSPGGPGRDESPMTPDDLINIVAAVQAASTVPPALSQEWAALTDQLIAELGMDPEAALMAAADELGIEYG